MPDLRLQPVSLEISLTAGDPVASIGLSASKNTGKSEYHTIERLFLTVKLADFTSVRLATGGNLKSIEGVVIACRDTERRPEGALGAIGTLSYVAAWRDRDGLGSEDASYEAHCWLPTRQFDALVAAASGGYLPSVVSLGVAGEGATLGWEPDGSGLDWDNASHPRLPVEELSVQVPILVRAEEGAHQSNQSTPLYDQIATLVREIQVLRRDVRAVAIAVAFIAGILFVSRLAF